LELKGLALQSISYSILAVTFILTFLVSIFSIKILLKIVRGDNFYKFGIYDFILGALVLVWSFVH
jgi:undecaprenyl pyrophosphate phosphatase UppP